MIKSFRRTTAACFIGIFTQAIITNITAILFVPMMTLYGFTYYQFGILVAINFTSQVAAEILFSKVIDKIGYRKIILPTCVLSFVGLILFGLSPTIFADNIFLGLIAATFIFAFSGGLLEIILNPIIAGIPGTHKGQAMSLLHAFYAWGQVATIIITTIFIFVFGFQNWAFIIFFWALVPIICFIFFFHSPLPEMVPEEHRQKMSQLILKPFYIFAMLAIFFGAAAEVTINQWASTFMEKGLELPKIMGDLLGMCGFAIMLGLGRTLYGVFGSRININKVAMYGSLFTVGCYIVIALSPVSGISIAALAICGIAVSLLWPGTIVIASNKYKLAGAWIFAILAAAGGMGGAFGVWLTGNTISKVMTSPITQTLALQFSVTNEQAAIRIGILIAAIFPLGAFICHYILKRDTLK
jgi:fucose permease